MRGDTQPIETEIKLRFPPDARSLLQQHPTFRSSHASKPEEREVVTTYLDTPDQMLSRRGISLRVRRIGSTFGQTVKAMRKDHGGAKSRGEWEWPITSNKPDLSRLAETPVGSALTPADLAALQPIFTTTVCRTTRQVQLEDGTQAEVVLDQGEILADSAREPISELELELKAGRVGPLYRLALDLAMAATDNRACEQSRTRVSVAHRGTATRQQGVSSQRQCGHQRSAGVSANRRFRRQPHDGQHGRCRTCGR